MKDTIVFLLFLVFVITIYKFDIERMVDYFKAKNLNKKGNSENDD